MTKEKISMKQKIKIIAVVVVIAIISLGGIWFFSDHSKVKDGTYMIQNNTTYPDAYIVVDNGKAQFFNIDLNALYKDTIVEDDLLYLKNYKNQKLSSLDEEKVKDSIDLNAQFCETKFVLDYSRKSDLFDEDEGIGYYSFGAITDISHLSYQWDWKKRSITLTRPEAGLIEFRKW